MNKRRNCPVVPMSTAALDSILSFADHVLQSVGQEIHNVDLFIHRLDKKVQSVDIEIHLLDKNIHKVDSLIQGMDQEKQFFSLLS